MNSGFEAFQNHGVDRFRIFRNSEFSVFLRFQRFSIYGIDGELIYVPMQFLDSKF